MNVVVAADQFTSDSGYSVTKTGNLGPGQFKSYFFYIPPGTPAFKVDFSGPNATPGTGRCASYAGIHGGWPLTRTR